MFEAVDAQPLIGSLNTDIVWGMPRIVLLTIAASCALLVLASSRAPSRRAKVSTIAALHIDA